MIDELNKICLTKTEVDLSNYNTYKLVSKASIMTFPTSEEELISIIKVLKHYKSKWFVLGNGSNVILPKYYDGVVIKLDNFNKCIISENEVYVESGYMLNKLSTTLSNKGYTGYEWSTGIPGTIGGSIYGNAGAYKSSISEILKSVTIFDGKKVYELKNNELDFGYRTSIFKNNKNLIILSCKLKLQKGNIDEIKKVIKERTKKRIATQDLEHPSCGSVFRNPENLASGKLIEDLGLKGYKIGDAMVSYKHANFIINSGLATSEDIINLIEFIKKEVKNNYGIDLVLEQEIIK